MVSNTIYRRCRIIQYSLILSVYKTFYAFKIIDLKKMTDEMKWYRILYTAGVEPFNSYSLILSVYNIFYAFKIIDLKNITDEMKWYRILYTACLLYTSPSPRDKRQSRMPSSA